MTVRFSPLPVGNELRDTHRIGRWLGARIPSGPFGKEINILLSPGIETKFFRRTVLIYFNISVLPRLIVVEGVEPIT